MGKQDERITSFPFLHGYQLGSCCGSPCPPPPKKKKSCVRNQHFVRKRLGHSHGSRREVNPHVSLTPSSEADSSSASQKIPRILWDTKVHYHVYNSPPLVPNLSHMNPVHTAQHHFYRTTVVLSSQTSVALPSGHSHSGSHTKIMYALLLHLMNTTCVPPSSLI